MALSGYKYYPSIWSGLSYSRWVSVTRLQPLGNVRSFSPTDNCDCLDFKLPRNTPHRWQERENIEDDLPVSCRPRHNCALNISYVGWCVLFYMFVRLYGCRCSLWLRVYNVCVCQRLSLNAACGSYIAIVKTRQGALLPLCLPGADFHPRWAGRLDWLLGWHSLDDLGRKEARHTAIHGHIMHTENRKAVVV